MLDIKFGFKMFEYYGNIPGRWAYEPLGPIVFSESLIFSPTAQIFSPTTHFLQDFHLK